MTDTETRGVIAIVGLGPKGLHCFERLAIELTANPVAAPPIVHLFDPHWAPGAGTVYEPTQPRYLRLNFANRHIDVWSRDQSVSAWPRPTFLEFLRAEHPADAEPAGYAPRALVGEYLTAAFSTIHHVLGRITDVRLHHESVTAIASSRGRHCVETAERKIACDEVLIATGHASRTAVGHGDPTPHSLGPYPIDRPGGLTEIEPGQTVAVRGLGLTSIDVILALTEGRGGRFESNDSQPGKSMYLDASNSPRVMLPYSRTGRTMVPKDDPTHGPYPARHDEVIAESSSNVKAIDGAPSDVLAALQNCVVHTATKILTVASDGQPIADVRGHLTALLERHRPALDAVAELQRNVDVAHGQCAPGPEWALGVTWSRLYPAIVDLFATRQLDAVWPRFARLATEMERIAFGPPAENASRFNALVQAGLIDLSMATNPTVTVHEAGYELNNENCSRRLDHLVDAVLAPPGVGHHPSPLIESLLNAGQARRMQHAPGLDVLSDGTCRGRDGQPVYGLSAVGRLTEGCVLGNDTLSRSLHDTPAQWACAATKRMAT